MKKGHAITIAICLIGLGAMAFYFASKYFRLKDEKEVKQAQVKTEPEAETTPKPLVLPQAPAVEISKETPSADNAQNLSLEVASIPVNRRLSADKIATMFGKKTF